MNAKNSFLTFKGAIAGVPLRDKSKRNLKLTGFCINTKNLTLTGCSLVLITFRISINRIKEDEKKKKKEEENYLKVKESGRNSPNNNN